MEIPQFLRRGDFGPLSDEPVPTEPPPDDWFFPDPEAKKNALQNVYVATYLSGMMLESAWRLVEISHLRQGRYRDGLDVPSSCRAAAAGAIALACAGFEASLNEDIGNAASWARDQDAPDKARLLEVTIELPLRRRLDALGGIHGQVVDWGREPFQALELVLTIRNYLLHHEMGMYLLGEGNWPAKKLKELPRRIDSPYADEILEWHHHVLTPAGAEWAVRAVIAVMEEMHRWWSDYRPKLEKDG